MEKSLKIANVRNAQNNNTHSILLKKVVKNVLHMLHVKEAIRQLYKKVIGEVQQTLQYYISVQLLLHVCKNSFQYKI